MSLADDRLYAFEGFVLDARARELREGGRGVVPLTGRAFDTLLYLLQQRDRVVGKDELLAKVWAGRVVEENNLTQAISAIRRALGAGAGDHRFLVTVPGHGYRFVAEVGVLPPVAGDATAAQRPAFEDTSRAAIKPGDSPATPPRRRRLDGWRHPMLLLLAAIAAFSFWAQRTDEPAAEPASSLAAGATLAVLPFRPLSNAAHDDLLALGLADTLITRIGSSTTLQVRSLASSQRFLNSSDDPLAAAKQLGARYVLEGTTQRSGDEVRVGVRLHDATNGRLLWSGSFDERVDHVFTLQDRVANALTQTLALKVAAQRGGSPCDGANAEAYRAYLGGQYQLNRPSADRMREALQDFHRAIDLDPSCARAYAGMAFAHRALVMTADHVPRDEFPLAKAAVAKALEINPELAEAYASQGFIQFWYDWDWAGSEASFKRAIALNPSLAEAHMGYAHLLSNIGRRGEAAKQARQAITLDPLSPLVSTLGASFIAEAGGQEEAIRILSGVAERDPDFWTVWLVRGRRQAMQGNSKAAIADLQRAARGCRSCAQGVSVLGAQYARSGDRAAAEAILRQLEEKRRTAYAPATALAIVRNALGDHEGALDLLEQGYAERDVRMSFLGRDSNWDNLRTMPRFRALMQELRLQEPLPQKP